LSAPTASERLFEELCGSNGIPCSRLLQAAVRAPDFVVELRGVQIACEIKQNDLNDEDRKELAELNKGTGTGRYLANRLRGKLKDVSAYTHDSDVRQAMFGQISVRVETSTDLSLPPRVPTPSPNRIVAWGLNAIRRSARSQSLTAVPDHRCVCACMPHTAARDSEGARVDAVRGRCGW
jgi:hypothetical protein